MVYLIGAGPGSPQLLTLRAVECLARADVVFYDRLVSTRILQHAPRAQHHCVDEFPGGFAERWPDVAQAVIDAAKQGKVVARLKGGDPSIFGRLAEEADLLAKAGVAFEIVPGVTAAVGAAAYGGFPLTQRDRASAVAFVTGHEDPDKPDSLLDWESLARFPGTLVFYMGVKRIEQIVSSLVGHGKDPATPAALVHWATLGRQRTIESSLQDLPKKVQQLARATPTVIVIGSVLELRDRLTWFEQRPLFGKRVLITRPSHQARDALSRLEELGAVTYSLPTVEIDPPEDWSCLDHALDDLARYQWLVFTSANGVEHFMRRLRETGRDLRALGHLRLAAIGPSTADVLRSYHLEPDVIPSEYRSEGLVDALRNQVRGQRVLLARANRGRELLRDELAKIADVEQVTVYCQRDVEEIPREIGRLLSAGEVDYVTLTAPNVARSFARLIDEEASAHLHAGRIKLISISPVTSATIREELKWPISGEARKYDLEGVIEAIVNDVKIE